MAEHFDKGWIKIFEYFEVIRDGLKKDFTEQEWTYSRLAEKLLVEPATVKAQLSDKSSLTIETAKRYVAAFGGKLIYIKKADWEWLEAFDFDTSPDALKSEIARLTAETEKLTGAYMDKSHDAAKFDERCENLWAQIKRKDMVIDRCYAEIDRLRAEVESLRGGNV